MKYKACIFDLDGTTVDSLEAIAHTANEVLTQIGLQAQPVESYKFFAGDGQFELIKRALIAAGDKELSKYDRAMPMYIESFKTGCIYNVKACEGVFELLKELKKRNIKIATLSNKRHVNTVSVIETVFGKDFFDIIQGQTDEIPKKPAPDGALLIAKRFGLNNDECLYIGDTNVDMVTGNAAMMDTVGVTWGFRSREELINANASFVVDKAEEILRIIEEND